MRDPSIYRITYQDDSEKLATRRVLGSVIGATKSLPMDSWQKVPVKIERAANVTFEDVTFEFLQSEGAR